MGVTRRSIAFFAPILTLSIWYLACGGDDSSPSSPTIVPSPDSGSPNLPDGSQPTGNDGSTPADGGVDAPVTTACDDYCRAVMAACTGGKAQYADIASCTKVCAELPSGAAGDTKGDTIGCREHALAQNDCFGAGPTGGDMNIHDAGGGVCGSGCEAFCAVAQTVCDGINKQFADTEVCLSNCLKANALSAPYSTADTTKDDYGCRFYHLTLATAGGTTLQKECQYIVPSSVPCRD
jgi:hypothetical protein